MLKIKTVLKNCVAHELNIKKGDKLVKFNGYEAEDLIDYLFYEGEENFTLTIERDGKIFDFEIEKYSDESLGIEFESDNLEIKTCQNACIFCFVDQMPKGMRHSLYIKDDDYRQSFLCGNYVTLTNVTEKDIERIIRLRLSPLYISVHATDGEVRKKLLNNRFADKILEYIKRFNENNIEMHTQVVLIADVNDKKILDETCFELSVFKNVKSLAVVPCGITAYREGLFNITDIDKNYAIKIIEQVKNINKNLNRNFVLVSDEFYLKAEVPLENSEFYDGYCQHENGVGMLSLFEDEFNEIAERLCYRRTFLVLTGISIAPFIRKISKKAEQLINGLTLYVKGVENKFFGNTVTCAGLLSGVDILNAVLEFDLPFDELILPSVMIRDNLFLDDLSVSDLEKRIKKPIRISPSNGSDFFKIISSDINL